MISERFGMRIYRDPSRFGCSVYIFCEKNGKIYTAKPVDIAINEEDGVDVGECVNDPPTFVVPKEIEVINDLDSKELRTMREKNQLLTKENERLRRAMIEIIKPNKGEE